MTSDEIQAMFQANAKLMHCSDADPQKLVYANAVAELTNRYIHDNFANGTNVHKMDIQEALDILVNACQTATKLECAYHPDGMTDEQIAELVEDRKQALDYIVEELTKSI